MDGDEPGLDAWTEHTTAFDRVRSVAGTVTEPRSAAWIAAEAGVSENTARSHLRRLVEMNVLLERTDGGTTRYEPDPLHTRLRTLRDLLDEYDHEGLIELKEGLQSEIETWRSEYGVDSPAALRELAAESGSSGETASIREDARVWELAAYRLDIVEDAIENYRAYDAASA